MIHVERYGSGPDAYFGLHGWGGNHLTFAPLVPYLPAEASLYSIDFPGYGLSPKPARWDAEEVALAVAQAIGASTTGEVTLLGNCTGAIFGLLAATLEPGRIRRLVLIDPFAYVPWYFRVFVHPHYGEVAYRSAFANPVGRWVTNASLRHRRTAETHLTDSFKEIDPDISLNYLRMLDALGSIRRFAGIDRQIDIAYGAHTFAAVKDSVAQWCELWPHSRQWPLAGAGHLPIEEAPAALAAIAFRQHAGGSSAHLPPHAAAR